MSTDRPGRKSKYRLQIRDDIFEEIIRKWEPYFRRKHPNVFLKADWEDIWQGVMQRVYSNDEIQSTSNAMRVHWFVYWAYRGVIYNLRKKIFQEKLVFVGGTGEIQEMPYPVERPDGPDWVDPDKVVEEVAKGCGHGRSICPLNLLCFRVSSAEKNSSAEKKETENKCDAIQFFRRSKRKNSNRKETVVNPIWLRTYAENGISKSEAEALATATTKFLHELHDHLPIGPVQASPCLLGEDVCGPFLKASSERCTIAPLPSSIGTACRRTSGGRNGHQGVEGTHDPLAQPPIQPGHARKEFPE